jgi:pyruvate carboxylase subunit B
MEFGGGARYQAPYFYCGEDPFECMATMRQTVGDDVILQILTRSVSGVTLTTQSPEALKLQARMMKDHGTTWDRNFDFMNDVAMLEATGQAIVESGMHHQACVALMGLSFENDQVHTAEFYINVAKRIMEMDCQVDSLCLKDASGTTPPHIVYEAAKGIRPLLPDDMPLWFHTHDTASTAVACNMAAIQGGVDGIDLAVRPLASGTSQPDVRSMAHALKGTGYSLDIDATKMPEIESLLNEGLADYHFNPVTTSADARVTGFPMPGGAIGPNVHMMEAAGILDKYDAVLAEFPVVVQAGGAWTSVTPGSQQYWLQAFNNVLHGRWEKIDSGYGRSVLGYFGKTPLQPDPDVVKKAAEQLKLEPFDGNPLDAAPNNIDAARDAIKAEGLEASDKNTFLVLAAMTPEKKMSLNEGMLLLKGKPRIQLPLKKADAEPSKSGGSEKSDAAASPAAGPTTSLCTVIESGQTRVFQVTMMPAQSGPASSSFPAPPSGQGAAASPSADGLASAPAAESVDVYSPFEGETVVAEIMVHEGDEVDEGDTVAQVEAMKAYHNVTAPVAGTVAEIFLSEGDMTNPDAPILSINPAP